MGGGGDDEFEQNRSLTGSNDHTLKIGTLTHLTMNKDTELALRFSTGIKNGAEFFTDLNGFQVIHFPRHFFYSHFPT